MVRFYRPFSLAAFLVFSLAGLAFLFIPGQVVTFFNGVSGTLGLPPSPTIGANFYLILAVAYMYVVTLLAYLMFRHPRVTHFPFLLANAKLASSLLSLYLFLSYRPYLIYLVNCIVDGLIGAVALFFYFRIRDVEG